MVSTHLTLATVALVVAGCHADAPDVQPLDNDTTGSQEIRTLAVNDRGVRLVSVKEQNGLERIRLENGSASMLVLPQDTRLVQDETKSGMWLIYIWASWNTYEVAELLIVAEAAESLSGTAEVGVRTYADYSDIPDLPIGPHASSYWLVLSEGKVLDEQSGYLTRDQVIAFVREASQRDQDNTRLQESTQKGT